MTQATVTTIELVSESPEQTHGIGAALARNLRSHDVVTLQGELGSGKTCLVRGLAEGLGIDGSVVSSPTFVIAHEYTGKSITLAHVDAYRLSGPDDLETIGWSELLASDDVIIAVEWPERIAAALPQTRIELRLQPTADSQRLIRISTPVSLSNRLVNLQSEPARAPITKTACRMCGRAIDQTVATFPFCSERCRLADLGAWFREGYRMARPVEHDDENGE